MALKVQDLVKFRGDKLFHGAVSVDWFQDDKEKSKLAAESFVFHGPKYHGVTQADVGITHDHQLQDTASFTRAIIRRCCTLENEPFTLAIAGYGTGKSHIALTLAALLSEPKSDIAQTILKNINSADSGIASEINAILCEEQKPILVVALNGMRSFDLTSEVTRQLLQQIRDHKLDAKPLDELRPRFKQAANLIRVSSDTVLKELLEASDVTTSAALLDALDRQDETIYGRVHSFFSSRGMPIRALGGESVRDVIDIVSREYCGEGKPFGNLLIIFDEFGRYTEFATVRSQVAGSGVLQDLFEGVQAHADTACFVGFIQFELNAYVQRVAPEYKNEILRYVTRYQSANKAYLSINLETLIAHLLEKQDSRKLDSWFDGESALKESTIIIEQLHKLFPQSRNHRLWGDQKQFHTVIRKGCWPLSPYATWFLFYLTAAGKHLQERSALTLLGNVFDRTKELEIPDTGRWALSPVDLWSNELQQELIASEEAGQQGSIAHAFSSIAARYGNRLSDDQIRALKGVVLASKMGMQVRTRDEAIGAISDLVGAPIKVLRETIEQLQSEYNVLEWDERFKEFTILGDAVPRTQFLSFIRRSVASAYDEEGKAKLFASKVNQWCNLLGDLECDFAEENVITTKEWHYQGVVSNMGLLQTHIKFAVDRWFYALSVDEPRGNIIYCYAEQSRDSASIVADIKKMLRSSCKDAGYSALPILVVVLYDEEGILGQALAELTILDNMSQEELARFGNLVGAHREKMLQVINSKIDSMLKQRLYITPLSEELESGRLGRVGTEIFSRIYKKPLPFPFDGFSTARGNAADTCQSLTSELLHGSLDYDAVIAKPAKIKNRAIAVLSDSWKAFTKQGDISRRPSHPILRGIIEKWDELLESDSQQFILGDAIKSLCMPPHGANIASAGMLLGLFVAPRHERVAIARNGEQYAISQWIQEGVFKGKYLDIGQLQDVELVLIAQGSSEWDTLLDDWELAESYYDKKSYLERGYELRNRVPVPPALRYRFIRLEEQASTAIEALDKMDKSYSDALSKMQEGYKKSNVGTLSWGASDLSSIKERMITEKPLWSDHQIDDIQPLLEKARQAIIQIFPSWLMSQSFREATPDAVGTFKHKMLRVIGNNLKKLELISQYDELEARTNQLVKDAETAAEAQQLIRNVRSWLSEHADAFRIIRIATIRGYQEIGKDYSTKLQGISKRITMPEISEVRTELATFMTKLKGAETDVKRRAERLWNSKIKIEDDLKSLSQEIGDLIRTYEGCARDLEDFGAMNSALRYYQNAYNQMSRDDLTWQEFEEISGKLKQEIEVALGDEEPPWPIGDTLSNFYELISKQRKQASLTWINAIESEAVNIDKMSASDANRLHTKASSAPASLTELHAKRVSALLKRIELRLEGLALDWLIEKFKELPIYSKKKFIQIVSEMF